MAKTEELKFTSDQARKLVDWLSENTDSHAISKEKSLREFAKHAGLKLEVPAAASRTPAKGTRAKLFVGKTLLMTVGLVHRSTFAKMVKEEGLGGHVNAGNWWGFTSLYLVEDLAKRLCGFSSFYEGRGRRHGDCIDALRKWANGIK